MRSRARSCLRILVALAIVVPCVHAGDAHADGARTAAVTLIDDPPGLTGTLHEILRTPANDILGADDRGLYKWTFLGGWTLLLQPSTVPSCQLSGTRVRCYDDPIRVGWGSPQVFPTSGNNFVVIEPMGVTGNIAVNSSVAGKMAATWRTVNVDSGVFVQTLCGGGDDPEYPTEYYAIAWDTSLPEQGYVYKSVNFGSTWVRTTIDPTDLTAECTYWGISDSPVPSIDDVVHASNPSPLGYLGPNIAGYVETPTVRMVLTYGGVFASTDGGLSWVPQSRGINVHPGLRLLYTRSGDTQIAGGMSEQESALFRSADAGATFRRVGGAPTSEPFTYVRLQSETVAYAGYVTSDSSSSSPREGPRLYTSVDKGETWAPLNDGAITFEQSTPYAGQFLRLVAEGTTSTRLVVVTAATNNRYYVATSDDAGLQWSNQVEMTQCRPSSGEPYVAGDVMMVPASNVGGSRGYCRTTDAGSTWDFVGVTSNSRFVPGAMITQPNNDLLILSALAPFVSTDGGATFELKQCATVKTPIGPVVAGSFDASGGLWAVYFDYTGSSYPNVFYSPDQGCSWNLTNVNAQVDDSAEDQVLDVEPDPEVSVGTESARGSRVHSAAAAPTWRQVRIIGVGNKGSTLAKVYWGTKPSVVRTVRLSSRGKAIVVSFSKPSIVGPGTITYKSQCSASGKRTSTVSSDKLTRTHTNLSVGTLYTCTVVATNPMGTSATVSKSIRVAR